MALNSMSETRRHGDNKRLDALRSLDKEAGDRERLSITKKERLVNEAVDAATGLIADGSKMTFRSQCELVLRLRDGEFESVLTLADRIWQVRKITAHSKLQLVVRICASVVGRRGSIGIPLSIIEKDYDTYGILD